MWAAYRGNRKVLKLLLPLSTMDEAEVTQNLTPEVRAKLKLRECSKCGEYKLKLKVCGRCGSERYWCVCVCGCWRLRWWNRMCESRVCQTGCQYERVMCECAHGTHPHSYALTHPTHTATLQLS